MILIQLKILTKFILLPPSTYFVKANNLLLWEADISEILNTNYSHESFRAIITRIPLGIFLRTCSGKHIKHTLKAGIICTRMLSKNVPCCGRNWIIHTCTDFQSIIFLCMHLRYLNSVSIEYLLGLWIKTWILYLTLMTG